MKHVLGLALAAALLAGARSGAVAASVVLTPMSPGFHQLLMCAPQGYVTIDVAAADPKVAPHASIVTTVIAAGPSSVKTMAVREVDGQGNIYALGYVVRPGVVKHFARRLLLPAAPPPAAGERSSYFNLSGIVIDKHFEGIRPAHDGAGILTTGYVFSDYLSGSKLNEIVYVPGTGVTEARFFGASSAGNLVCGR